MDSISPSSPAAAPTADGERLVKLALCVKAHPGIALADICRALPAEYGPQTGSGASVRRRFERDKDTLREYGVFVSTGPENRYSIDEKASYAAPVDLTEAQESLLRLLCNALLEDPQYPFKSELRMILAKIGEDIDVPDLLPSMAAHGTGSGDRPMAGLKKVRKSITKRKRLFFEYRDAHGAPSSREVEPFGCFLLNKNCYVVAFDPAAKGERVFRLDRMRKIRVNAKAPGKPDFAPRDFDASNYYGLPFQFGEEDFEAKVRFDVQSAWRAPRLAMSQGRLDALPDGTLIWTVRARDTRSLARWCIENGPGLAPISPERARDAYIGGLEAVRDCLQGKKLNAPGQDEGGAL